MRPFQTVINPALSVQTAADYTDARVLAANVPELHTVPSGAKFVEIKSTADAYVNFFRVDTDTDNVTNGTFASDTSWTKGTGWTIAAGVASSDASQTGQSLLQQAGAVVEGQAYYVTFTVTAYSAGNVRPKIGGTAGTNRSSQATFSEIIIAGSDGVVALDADADFNGSVDNFSCVPCAKVPAADQIVGLASELVPAGVPMVRACGGIGYISLVSGGTPVVTMSFYA